MNKRTFRLLGLLAVVASASCGGGKPTAVRPDQPSPSDISPPENATGHAADQEARAPLRLTLSGPKAPKAGEQIEVSIVVERTAAAFNPLELRVALPRSAKLVDGELLQTIDDKASTKWARVIKVQIDEVPAEDIVVTVDVRGDGFGAHASSAYRFGRPEPRLPDPPTDTPRSVGGLDVGSAIPLGQPKK